MISVNINKDHIPSLVGLTGLQGHQVWQQLLSAYARAYMPAKPGCSKCRPDQGSVAALQNVAGATLRRMDNLEHALIYHALCDAFKSQKGKASFTVSLGTFRFTIDP